MPREFIVHGSAEGRLVRDILQKELRLSQRAIKRVKMGGILVDGTAVTVRHILKEDEVLTVTFPTEDGSEIRPYDMPLDILYEDDSILVINKAPNMPVHPCRGNHLPTLAEGVMHYLGDGFVFRAVNRLDRDTSGIVLIAKDADSAYRLGERLKRGEFKKEYLAVVVGVPSPETGKIETKIARECEGEMRRVVREDGKYALTEYTVLSSYEEEIDGEIKTLSLVRVVPKTGRTHQIRVHMAHIGTPLLYDFLYGEPKEGEHFLLHCGKMTFLHPRTNEELTVLAPCPFT